MTLEEIKKYPHIREQIEAIQAEIESIYGEVPSPGRFTASGKGQNKESPTERKFRRIEKLREKKAQLEAMSETIEDYVLFLDDWKLKEALRLHFLIGLTWESTSREILGHDSYQQLLRYVRKAFPPE